MSHDIIGKEGELSLDDYVMIYHSTGVDIDGRLRSVQRRVTSYAARLTTYLMFMSTIPGFNQIPEIDRDALASGKHYVGVGVWSGTQPLLVVLFHLVFLPKERTQMCLLSV